jgi:pimeloyl-ACP methyl ester carboxylesterase
MDTGIPLDPEQSDAALPDIDWTRLPAGATRFWRQVPSGRLAALAAGLPGRPRIVLAPGVTGSKEDFHFLFPLFAAAGYRVESYDAAGQYESAEAGPERLHPPRRHYDYDLFVDDLLAIIEQGATPVHLLGHSFQGVVAQLVAVRRPDLVRSLTLLSSPPVAGDALRRLRQYGPASPSLPAAALAWIVRRGILANAQHVLPRRQRFVTARFGLTRIDSHRDSMRLLRRVPDVRSSLRGTGIPILDAVGARDLWPVGLQRRYAAEIGADLRVYPGGHSPCETTPHELGRDMLALFEATARAARGGTRADGREEPGEPPVVEGLLPVGDEQGPRRPGDAVPQASRTPE